MCETALTTKNQFKVNLSFLCYFQSIKHTRTPKHTHTNTQNTHARAHTQAKLNSLNAFNFFSIWSHFRYSFQLLFVFVIVAWCLISIRTEKSKQMFWIIFIWNRIIYFCSFFNTPQSYIMDNIKSFKVTLTKDFLRISSDTTPIPIFTPHIYKISTDS